MILEFNGFELRWNPQHRRDGIHNAFADATDDGTTITLAVRATREQRNDAGLVVADPPVAKAIKLPLAAVTGSDVAATHATLVSLLDDPKTWGDPAKPPVVAWPQPDGAKSAGIVTKPIASAVTK